MNLIQFNLISISQQRLYNPKQKKGYLYHKLKNVRAAQKPNLTVPVDESDCDQEELKLFLKTCVVKKDKKALKEKLKKTITLRRQLMQCNQDEFADFFKFYFVDPELV